MLREENKDGLARIYELEYPENDLKPRSVFIPPTVISGCTAGEADVLHHRAKHMPGPEVREAKGGSRRW